MISRKSKKKGKVNNEKQTILKGLIIGVCALTLTGCGMGQTEGQDEDKMPVTEQYQNDISGMEDILSNKDEKGGTDPETDDVNGNGNTEQFKPNEDNDNTEQPLPDESALVENQNNITANNTDEKVDADSLYASAAMTGSVVDFSDGSCTVSAAVTEDDGKTGVVAAPGYESEDTNVVVTYQEGCVVQIATIYTSTGIAELEQVSVADIKKQASVIIYGSFEDTHHVTATKIIICHRTA